jgi:hypothetical protein
LLGCAVVEYTYYCKVTFDRADIKPGLYMFQTAKNSTLGYNRLVTLSHKIWRQGPKGGVKIIKDKENWAHNIGYVTTNEKIMKEFMWAKLQAQSYIKGA